MNQTNYLFDVKPFKRTCAGRRFDRLPPGVQAALLRLEGTVNAVHGEGERTRGPIPDRDVPARQRRN